jgi:D-3-phosphoglycerate dehydrogenase
MFQIKTFNAIAQEGLQRLDPENYAINESDNPEGIYYEVKSFMTMLFPKVF